MAHMRNKMQIIGIFSFACILFCVVVRLLFHFSGIDLLKFLFCQIFAIFLPGLVVGIFIYKEGTIIEIVSFGYAIGYCINIIEYFVLYTLHLERFSLVLVFIVAATAVYILVEKQKDINYGEEKHELALLLIFSGYMLVSIMLYSANYLSPRYNPLGFTEMNRDLQFWCSNAVSLKNSFFPNATYFTDATLFYHYFSSMHVGFLSKLTGIDVFSLAFTLYPFGKCILLVGGFNFLLNRYKLESGKIFLMSLILFIPYWLYVAHLTARSFGLDIGVAFGFWYLATFILLIRKEKFNPKLCGLNLLFWFVCCGAKAPVASVLIFIPFFYCCLWLVQRKFGRAFGYGGGVVGLFLIVSIVCSGMLRIFMGAQQADGESFSMLLYSSQDSEYLNRYAKYGKLVMFVHNVIYRMYRSHQVLFIVTLFCFALFLFFFLKKKMEMKNVVLATVMLVTTVIGYIMRVVINAGGGSEYYFAMTADLTAIVFDAVVIERAWQEIKIKEHFLRSRFVQVAVVCLGLYGAYHMVFAYDSQFLKSLKSGYDMITGNGSFSEVSFSLDEANACIWIKEHSDKDVVVVNDRTTVGGESDIYYFGIFSERPQYIEATGLLAYVDLRNKEISLRDEMDKRIYLAERLYGNDVTVIEELKEAGVRYVIQNDNITPSFLYEEGLLEEKYVSGDITVYEIV